MAATEPLPVAVCSPQPVVRTGLKTLLGRHPEQFRIVPPTGGPGQDPAVVLYDVLALGGGNDELVQLLGQTQARVIAVGRDLRPDLASRALAAGVDGCLSLGVDEDELVAAVTDAGTRRSRSGPRARANVVPSARASRVGAEFGLSPREADVLALIVQGLTNQQIAGLLYLSINSVKTYVRNAYGKVGATNRSQAVGWAVRNGFAGSNDSSA